MAVNRDKVLREAEKLVQKGKIEAAIREYQKLLKANPNDTNTINRVGDLFGRIGQLDKAIELYERIANSFTTDGFTTKAIAILKKINRLAPQRLDIFERLAELYIQQGLVVEAKNQYQILVDWHLRNSEIEEAITKQRQLVDLDPGNHMALLKLADLLFRGGKATEALVEYDRLGEVLLQRNKLDEAERLYRHALEQDPPTGEFLAPLVGALLDAGRHGPAREFLEDGLQRSPDSSSLRVMEIRVLVAAGESSVAVQKVKHALDIAPDRNAAQLEIGRAFLDVGEAAEARELLIPTIDRSLAQGDFKGAQGLLQDLLRLMPQDPKVLRVAVRAYEPSGNTEMVFTLKAALADHFFRNDEEQAAKRIYLELLDTDPQNQLFRQRLAKIDGVDVSEIVSPGEVGAPSSTGGPSEASSFSGGDAAQLRAETPIPTRGSPHPHGPPDFDPHERFAEANVFAKYGLVDKALHHLEDIVQAFPEMIAAREKLVLLNVEQGRADVARQFAGPLAEHYRAQGDSESLEALADALPELAGVSAAFGRDSTGTGIAPESFEWEGADDRSGVTGFQAQASVGQSDDDGVILLEIDESDVDLDDAEFTLDAPDSQLTGDQAPVEMSRTPPEISDGIDDAAGVVDDDDVVVVLDDDDLGHLPMGVEDAGVGLELASDAPAPPPVEGTVEPPTPEFDFVLEPEPERPPRRERFSSLDDLDELERALLGGVEVAHPSVPPRAPVKEPAIEPPPPAVEEGPSEPEELVEITGTISGPSLGDLEQVDFFIEQDLLDDALRLVEELESEHPGDFDVAERRLTLKAKGVLLEEVAVESEVPEDLFADEDEYIDLAKELEEELAEEEAMVDEATGRGKDEALLEEVFREFQKGVAEQLSEEDSDTHFNLGIAYKEMGLLPEAIREFQIASRDAQFLIECCSMIGVCYIEQGLADQATEWYEKALRTPDLKADAKKALRYDLASALELAGDSTQATELFAGLASEDASYRDVNLRLSSLEQQRQAQ